MEERKFPAQFEAPVDEGGTVEDLRVLKAPGGPQPVVEEPPGPGMVRIEPAMHPRVCQPADLVATTLPEGREGGLELGSEGCVDDRAAIDYPSG